MFLACNSCTEISIHAPARGATLTGVSSTPPGIYFNPRARERRDSYLASYPRIKSLFQSTRPREARPALRNSRIDFIYFNPRARERRDTFAPISRSMSRHFNPRARERRDWIVFFFLPRTIFQSTRPREARLQGFGSF